MSLVLVLVSSVPPGNCCILFMVLVGMGSFSSSPLALAMVTALLVKKPV